MGWTQLWELVSLGWGISDQPGYQPGVAIVSKTGRQRGRKPSRTPHHAGRGNATPSRPRSCAHARLCSRRSARQVRAWMAPGAAPKHARSRRAALVRRPARSRCRLSSWLLYSVFGTSDISAPQAAVEAPPRPTASPPRPSARKLCRRHRGGPHAQGGHARPVRAFGGDQLQRDGSRPGDPTDGAHQRAGGAPCPDLRHREPSGGEPRPDSELLRSRARSRNDASAARAAKGDEAADPRCGIGKRAGRAGDADPACGAADSRRPDEDRSRLVPERAVPARGPALHRQPRAANRTARLRCQQTGGDDRVLPRPRRDTRARRPRPPEAAGPDRGVRRQRGAGRAAVRLRRPRFQSGQVLRSRRLQALPRRGRAAARQAPWRPAHDPHLRQHAGGDRLLQRRLRPDAGRPRPRRHTEVAHPRHRPDGFCSTAGSTGSPPGSPRIAPGSS